MSDTLYFFVPMQPPSVTSQQKRLVMVGGKPRFFKSKAQKQAGNLYFALFQPHQPKTPMKGPLTLCLTFTLPWRKSERKAIQRSFATHPCDTRPDCDNRAKQAIDVLTALRFWEDDGQISVLRVEKSYGDTPGLTVHAGPALGLPREEDEIPVNHPAHKSLRERPDGSFDRVSAKHTGSIGKPPFDRTQP